MRAGDAGVVAQGVHLLGDHLVHPLPVLMGTALRLQDLFVEGTADGAFLGGKR
ncbi:hypothetical protein ACO0LV_17240 [Pseudactinotalea sp. Z1739]|uniref:hypothetical protein n=1 Tax=Pseudactinotalea sp. Z1739 TaxID=3413028 RepID=UPI003C7C32FB